MEKEETLLPTRIKKALKHMPGTTIQNNSEDPFFLLVPILCLCWASGFQIKVRVPPWSGHCGWLILSTNKCGVSTMCEALF